LEVSWKKLRSIDGEGWGEALADSFKEDLNRPDRGEERPFRKTIRTALQSRSGNFDNQGDTGRFDPETFELKKVR